MSEIGEVLYLMIKRDFSAHFHSQSQIHEYTLMLYLEDTYQKVFKPGFEINEDEVFATYDKPDSVQELKSDAKLFLRKINDEEIKSYLLLCAQLRNDRYMFTFSYWIPKELVDFSDTPLDVLKKFINTFGFRVKVGNTEDYFVSETTVALSSRAWKVDQVIEVLASKDLPVQFHFFYSNEFIVSENLIFVDVYYAFALNCNKYLTWLNDIRKENIRVPEEWALHLTKIIDVLAPDGKTQLEILKSSHSDISQESIRTKKFTEVAVPEKYVPRFKYISNVLTTLKPNENIGIIPHFKPNFCLFCNSEKTSKEHIFPVWMRPLIDEKISRISVYDATNSTEDYLEFLKSSVETRKESSHGYTTHMVCVECNNKWMSELENSVKSILVTDEGRLVEETTSLLEIEKAHILSRWLLKIVLLLMKKNLNNQFFSSRGYRMIKEGYIPLGVIVEITSIDSYKLDFFTITGIGRGTPIKLKSMTVDEVKEMVKSFFVSSIQIGKLLFRVSYLPTDIPLQRITYLRRTTVLYPYGAKLLFKELDGGEQIWNSEVSNGLAARRFSSAIGLVDR